MQGPFQLLARIGSFGHLAGLKTAASPPKKYRVSPAPTQPGGYVQSPPGTFQAPQLPSAPAFLRQLGLRVTGEIDRDHAFMLVARPGDEELVRQWLQRLFPNGGKQSVLMDISPLDSSYDGAHLSHGVVFTIDEVAALVLDETGSSTLQLLKSWQTVGHGGIESIGKTGEFPSKAQLMAATADGVDVHEAVWGDTEWKEVRAKAKAVGISARAVFAWLESQQVPSETPAPRPALREGIFRHLRRPLGSR